ncbi:hypothetical protein KJ866_01635 [Patescibacteria group bacterium]|nr:hypothetical protein [Patescibacteria group bacterium]
MGGVVIACIIVLISFGVLFWTFCVTRKWKKISQQQREEIEKGTMITKQILGL